MQITIKIDPYSRGILLLILGCLLWLCLEKSTALPALAGSDDPPKEKAPKVRDLVAARTFLLLDKDDKIRAALSMDTGAPSLTFMDSKGNQNVCLEIDELSFTVKGEPLFSLRLSKTDSILQLRDYEKKTSASLLVGHGGNVSFSLYSEKERSISLMATSDGMESVNLHGATPQEHVCIATDPNGWSSLSLGDSKKSGFYSYASRCVAGMKIWDAEHTPRIILGSDDEAPEKEPATWMRVIGKDGKDRWSAP